MELDILHKSTSDYIVEFYGAFFIESCVYYCMEYMDVGSLDKVYGAGVPEDVLAKITTSVSFMHHSLLGKKKKRERAIFFLFFNIYNLLTQITFFITSSSIILPPPQKKK